MMRSMAQQHHFFAIVLPGLERIAARELKDLSAHDIHIEYGGISFTGTMQLLHRINIRSRVITRVLMRLRTFRSMTLEGLKYDLEKVAWHLFLDESSQLEVEVHTHRSRLHHSDEIAKFAKQTIERLLPKITKNKTKPGKKHIQTLHIRLNNNRGTLSLDTSGERLDRRGYRLESGKAPIRETLAAAILQWAQWQPEQTLLTPMCGSGTFAIEAAMMATQRAPNLNHDFACLHWPSLKEKDFSKVVERCEQMVKDTKPHIFASDINESAINITMNNAKRMQLDGLITTSIMDIHQLQKPETSNGGLLLLNPPYGMRIGEQQKTLSLWHDIGLRIREQFAEDETWKTVIICPDSTHEKTLHLKIKRRLQVMHGGNKVTILQAE